MTSIGGQLGNQVQYNWQEFLEIPQLKLKAPKELLKKQRF